MRYKVQGTRCNVQRPTSNVEPQTANRKPLDWARGRLQTANFKLAAAVWVAFSLLAGCADPTTATTHSPTHAPTRIISLAPSITEVLYKLGLEDRVVGVTRYCDYPPEALEKPRVGGYFDVNFEAVLGQEPDLVILLEEHRDARDRLSELGIDTLAIDHSRVEGILQSITIIGERCGAKEEGEILRRSLENRVLEIQKRIFTQSPGRSVVGSRLRVLVAVGRSLQAGAVGEIYVSGRDGFYDDLISLAGGANAYGNETLKFPAISDEGLVRVDPDLIIEMVPDLAGEADRESMLELWRRKSEVRAVREGRVYILGEDYTVVPGPRFIRLLEDMVRILHGEKQRVDS